MFRWRSSAGGILLLAVLSILAAAALVVLVVLSAVGLASERGSTVALGLPAAIVLFATGIAAAIWAGLIDADEL
jgi:hypothetical protein